MTKERLEIYLNKRQSDGGGIYKYMKDSGVKNILDALSQEDAAKMKSRIIGYYTQENDDYNDPIRNVSADFSWHEFETMRILFLFP
jgi:hypothetical protein